MPKRSSQRVAALPAARFTRALDHGESATGATSRREGFCFVPEDDLAFALGFPHFKYLTDDREDPRVEAERLLLHGYPYLQVSYPAAAATRLIRALHLPMAYDLTPDAAVLRPEAIAALNRPDTMREDEALAIVRSLVTREPCPPPFASVVFLLVEAAFGPDKVAAAILDGLASVPAANWITHGHIQQEMIDTLALMALRLPLPGRDRVYAALHALQARICEEGKRDFDVDAAERELAIPIEQVIPPGDGRVIPPAWREEVQRRRRLKMHVDFVRQQAAGCGFDVLEGRAGVSPPRPVVRASAEAVQAARLQCVTEPWYSLLDPRLVFLGGEVVYRIERQLWTRYTAPTPPTEAQAIILDRFGRIRSPVTVELVLDMAMRSRVKARAKAWLAAHRDDAWPVLEEIARGSTRLAQGAVDVLSA